MKATQLQNPPFFRRSSFHQFYFNVTAIVIGIFGPIFFLGTMESTMEPARWTLDFLSWPLDGNITFNSRDTRFLSALTGGFLFGWGVTIWFLGKWVYPLAPEPLRKSMLLGIIAWFILDSSGSIASGNPSNAVINLFVLLVAVGPFWFPCEETK